MKEKNVRLDIDIEPVALEFLDPIDVTTIFGNLLDNAIEAVEQEKEEKRIDIKICSYHQMVVVRISNSCTRMVKIKNRLPVPTHGKDRGIGLLNVQRSIEKYDGHMEFKKDNDMFTVELFLNA